ncbi:alpha/beta-hydrolase [Mycena pura]|uniref:Carboxylic ester hydrolase n=1 Tax=Mycena pura TaxID=153505 RepID=A0AAD6YBI2_9AGAR|nr:alpha/beta-hydrolase [Mycena pura]
MVASALSLWLLALFPCAAVARPRHDLVSRAASVSTPLGTAQGVPGAYGTTRFAVRYANASRWAPSSIVTEWELPNGSNDPSALPQQCPQNDDPPDSTFFEDCLSMILYVPVGAVGAVGPSSASTMVWIHGGSFVSGSATNPGLDGSKLAAATNAIVAVIQYRLGVLGLFAPDGSTNLAVKDTINALTFLGHVLPAFGGDPAKITLAGQSSGAGMIRTLLATPSADALFRSAILQSDPMDYGFLSPATQALLQSTLNDLVGCSAADTACRAALSVADILAAQQTLVDEALGLDPSTGLGEPLRPTLDGALVRTPLDSTAPFPAVRKALLLTNVHDEAGPTVFKTLLPGPAQPAAAFAPVCDEILGPARTQTIVDSGFYPVDPAGDARVPLEVLGTDYLWRCPTWTFARNWVAHGGTAFVGLFTIGAHYPFNDGISYCAQAGVVCHQDDIEIVFGTVPNPTAAQAALMTEMQIRYRAFLEIGMPNVPGLPPWRPATATDVPALQLGNNTPPGGLVPVGACTPPFWGNAVPYDYQMFNI